MTHAQGPTDMVPGKRARHKRTTHCGASQQEKSETEDGFLDPGSWGELKIERKGILLVHLEQYGAL